MNRKTAWLGVLLAFGLASCGGEGPGLAGGRDGSGSGSGGGSDDVTVVEIGDASSGAFEQGVVGISATNLSSGGSTSLTVRLQTADGVAYTESADVTFSSDCQSAGLSEIAEPTVTTSVGTASTTYTAIGCEGSDTITARASINDQLLTAVGSLTVAPASLGSIVFVSTTPNTIGLKGTGAAGIQETATVKFKVLNDVGGPMPNRNVAFGLSTEVGGLSLNQTTAVSGSDGTVNVIVRSGTIPTSVRVTATVVDTDVSTQSSALTVTTAIPDDNSFSLSASVYNPEAWNYDNETVTLTVLAADRFNNLVPDDTAIVFTTELGAVVGQCLTSGGECTVEWRSQDPRLSLDNSPQDTGRTTLLAHAVGEESFEDEDGDGVFDGTIPCSDPPVGGADCFYDLPEAWLDQNENGVRNGPTEDFVDFNSNNTYDSANAEWDGIVCGSGACTANLTTVSSSLTLVMARSFANIMIFDSTDNVTTGPLTTGTPFTVCIAGAGTVVPDIGTITNIADITQVQTMPAGTEIEFASSVGELGGKTNFTIPSTTSQVPFCVELIVAGDASGDTGLFEISVTTPKGNETYRSMLIND